MKIVSVNTGKPERIGGPATAKFYPANTGSYKKPAEGPVFVGKLGLEEDYIGDLKHHGGVDQAVYIYSREDYSYWEGVLGAPCPPGLFGENLTVEGLLSAEALVGDQYVFGEVTLEVTSPRMPCSTLAARMEDAKFVKSFQKAGRPGVYCRVLSEGHVQAAQTGIIKRYAGERVTLAELFEEYPHKKISDEQRRRYSAVPSHWKLIEFLSGKRAKP